MNIVAYDGTPFRSRYGPGRYKLVKWEFTGRKEAATTKVVPPAMPAIVANTPTSVAGRPDKVPETSRARRARVAERSSGRLVARRRGRVDPPCGLDLLLLGVAGK